MTDRTVERTSGRLAESGGAGRRSAPPAPPAGQCDASVVEYIADMALSLRDMSAEVDQPFLGYLLEMVFQEAHSEALKLRFASTRQSAMHQA